MAAGKTVLHVDDEMLMRKMVRIILEAQGFQVFSAENSEAALQALARISPNLVLLDVNIGQENGYELCRRIRAQYPTLGAATAFVTTNKTMDDIRMAQSVGGDYFILKPFTPESLKSGVEKTFLMHNKRARK